MFEIQMPKADGKEMTQERLSEVFDLVKPQPNWKYPIDAKVPVGAATPAEISEAVVWFTGSLPEVWEETPGTFSVLAAGYYACIGA